MLDEYIAKPVRHRERRAPSIVLPPQAETKREAEPAPALEPKLVSPPRRYPDAAPPLSSSGHDNDRSDADLDDPIDDGQSADYEVGYARPPKAHRFKPGQSGNPKGRPKGAKGLNATVRKTMEQKIAVRSNGRTRKVSTFEALILKLREKALQGDGKAMDRLIALYRAAAPAEDSDVVDEQHVSSATDDAILARFLADAIAASTAGEAA